MQNSGLRNVSFGGLLCVKGSEKDVVDIAKQVHADIQGFGKYPAIDWVLATGDDVDKFVKLRNEADITSGSTFKSVSHDLARSRKWIEIKNGIFEAFASELPKLDAKEVLEAIKNGTFDLAKLAFKE